MPEFLRELCAELQPLRLPEALKAAIDSSVVQERVLAAELVQQIARHRAASLPSSSRTEARR